MKVEDKRKGTLKHFDEIAGGVFFEFKNEYFIKSIENKIRVGATNVQSGEVVKFTRECLIEVINAKVVIE